MNTNSRNSNIGLVKFGKAFYLTDQTHFSMVTVSDLEKLIKLNAGNFSKDEMLEILLEYVPIGTAASTIESIYDDCKADIRKRKIQTFLDGLDS